MTLSEAIIHCEEVADRCAVTEGSMRMMGEKAHKALNDYWSWIDGYMRSEQDEAD